jgi:hypothetical protein
MKTPTFAPVIWLVLAALVQLLCRAQGRSRSDT